MFTWDEEVKSSLRSIIEIAHYPDQPFAIVQMTRDRDHSGQVTGCQHHYEPLASHVERMERYGLTAYEAYMAVSDSSSGDMRLACMTESWAVAADFDDGLAELCQPGRPLAPTTVIETSPGHYHCLWQFDAPIRADRLGRLAKVIAARLDADMGFARANQMVRLPCFVNQKHGCP